MKLVGYIIWNTRKDEPWQPTGRASRVYRHEGLARGYIKQFCPKMATKPVYIQDVQKRCHKCGELDHHGPCTSAFL